MVNTEDEVGRSFSGMSWLMSYYVMSQRSVRLRQRKLRPSCGCVVQPPGSNISNRLPVRNHPPLDTFLFVTPCRLFQIIILLLHLAIFLDVATLLQCDGEDCHYHGNRVSILWRFPRFSFYRFALVVRMAQSNSRLP